MRTMALSRWRRTAGARAAAVGLALLLLLAVATAASAGLLGSQRVGTSAATFLKIGIGARSAAMGQSVVAVPGDPIALFQNPAGLADVHQTALYAERISWLADLAVTAVGVTAPVRWGGVAGLSVVTLGAELAETTELQPNGTGRTFSHRDLALGATYARHLTDRFSFGMSGRLIYEALGTEIGGPSGTTWTMDVGTTFHTGFRNVVLAVAIQNFGPDLTPGGSYTDTRPGQGASVEYAGFSPPTMFRLGSAYQIFAARRAELNFTGEFVRPNDNDETMRAGAELALADDHFFLRAGWDGASDALPWGGGIGLKLSRERSFDLQIDYAFNQSEFFDRVDRVAIKLGF